MTERHGRLFSQFYLQVLEHVALSPTSGLLSADESLEELLACARTASWSVERWDGDPSQAVGHSSGQRHWFAAVQLVQMVSVSVRSVCVVTYSRTHIFARTYVRTI